jgi:sortilin-related receptor
MVHWVGENSNVIICLAREGYPSSSVYISYDYGDTYLNKTEEFKIDATKNLYASIDKFYIHPAFKTHVIYYYLIMVYMFINYLLYIQM